MTKDELRQKLKEEVLPGLTRTTRIMYDGYPSTAVHSDNQVLNLLTQRLWDKFELKEK